MFAAITAVVSTVAKPVRSIGNPSESLDDVEEQTTISDVTTPAEIAHQLAGGWNVQFEVTQNRRGRLNQVATITHNQLPTEYRLEPTNAFDPEGEVTITRRQSRSSGRDKLNTVDTLAGAINLLNQRLQATVIPSPTKQPESTETAAPATAPGL